MSTSGGAADPTPAPGEPGHPWVFQDAQDAHASNSYYGNRLWVDGPSPYGGAVEGNPVVTSGFTINRGSEAMYQADRVYYTWSGSAEYGVDYDLSPTPGWVDFDPGELSKQVTLIPLNDGIAENTETATFDVLTPPGYVGGGSADVLILATTITEGDVVITSPSRTGTTDATISPGSGGTYKIVAGSVQAGPGAPAVNGNLFSLSQTSTGSASTQKLTLTYSGTLPKKGTIFTYSMAIEELNSPKAVRIRVEIK